MPTKRTGERCKNPAAWGTDCCKKHGGTSFHVLLEAGRRELEEAVAEWLRSLGHEGG